MKYFPFGEEVYRPQMGLKPLLLSEWIEYGPDRDAQLSLKRKLLRENREEVLKIREGSREACEELRALIEEHLKLHVPGFSPYAADGEPLAQVSLWTQEDWALLSPDPVRLEAACICFPSRWSLEEKMGRDPLGIHRPVPDYATIAQPTQNFLERITFERPVQRLNWTIHDSDELFHPVARPKTRTDLGVRDVLDACYLRVEKQTLRRLPLTKFVVFSIRTFLHPLREVLKDSERRRLLTLTLDQLPEATAIYKGMGDVHAKLREALHSS